MTEPNKADGPVNDAQESNNEMLDVLQRETFEYFIYEFNADNGLITDKTEPGSPSSIAAVGMGLSSYAVAAERGMMPRNEAVKRTLTTLRWLYASPQGTEADATGYKGFYYHFLDMKTGKRAWQCELSTIDTAILMAGVLTAGSYYLGDSADETELRSLAIKLYERVDWQWALNSSDSIAHGWMPETGFLHTRWDEDYSEAHILYIMALGSPTFPVDAAIYTKWIATFDVKTMYGTECIYAGPLFIHQMSQVWLDLKGIQDDLNRKIGYDYFENSRRATCVQQAYAIENPNGFAHYGRFGWGFTASDGPGPCVIEVDGRQREFFNYTARGIPFGPDDGTISPWAVVASLPFADKIVLDTIRHAIEKLELVDDNDYGFDASFNPTFPEKSTNPNGWVSTWQFGLNQGPIILMIENYRTGLVWNTFKKCPYIVAGLRRAGFTGGWLEQPL